MGCMRHFGGTFYVAFGLRKHTDPKLNSDTEQCSVIGVVFLIVTG